MHILPGDQNRSAHLGDNRCAESRSIIFETTRPVLPPVEKRVARRGKKKVLNLKTRVNGGEHVAQ